MQQKTDGRVVRVLTKHVSAEDQALEQWFLVAVGDDDRAKDSVTKAANATDEVIEIVGHIPAAILATWGMTGAAYSSWRAYKRVTSSGRCSQPSR